MTTAHTPTFSAGAAGDTGIRAEGGLQALRPGAVLALGGRRGWLSVVAGRVWLTRADDLDDHWLAAGQSVHLERARDIVVEAWGGRPATVVWHRASRLGEVRSVCRSCWELVDPRVRRSVGATAAVTALAVGAALFGPAADRRTDALVATLRQPQAAVAVADNVPAPRAARELPRALADAGSRPADAVRVARTP